MDLGIKTNTDTTENLQANPKIEYLHQVVDNMIPTMN